MASRFKSMNDSTGDSPPPEEKSRRKALPILARAGTLLLVVALSVGIYLLRDQAKWLASLGYVGIFVLSILANATIILPAPGVAFVFGMGAVYNPLLVALAAGAGAAIGELSGYLAGYSGNIVVKNRARYQKIIPWMTKYGPWTILVLGFIPNPIFDLAGIVAGMLKMPLWKFLVFCMIGKIIKMLLFAYAGSLSIPWLAPD
ncbi:MAG: VTT domain-containing protein [Anaerolineales bacterium]|nr:VTT domain-containing protein [Anaerolineales bacterium]